MTESVHISSGDALIYCECSGCKDHPPLILLHGNGEDLHYFDPQISFFRDRYRVIAIDSRGHGQSTRGTAPLDFNTMAGDVLHVMDALHIGKAHILGFSDGANLSLYLALQAPERISSMILLGANYSPEGLRLVPRIFIRLSYIWLMITSLFSEKRKRKKEIWRLMIDYPQLTVGEISRISVPSLIITGENDMVSQKQNDEIHLAIKGSVRITVPDADHFLSSKKAGEFNRIAEKFLSATENRFDNLNK